MSRTELKRRRDRISGVTRILYRRDDDGWFEIECALHHAIQEFDARSYFLHADALRAARAALKEFYGTRTPCHECRYGMGDQSAYRRI